MGMWSPITGCCSQQRQAKQVYLVWAELELVAGETVTQTQGHWCQVLPCQPTAMAVQQQLSQDSQRPDSM